MRNIFSIISGAVASFVLISFATYLLLKFNIGPYHSIANNQIDADKIFANQQQLLKYNYLFVLPLAAFVASFIVALISKSKVILLSVISILPCMIYFFDYSIYWLISIVLSVSLLLLSAKLVSSYKTRKNG